MWYDSPAKLCNVRSGHQTDVRSSVIMLQAKGCLLLWPASGNEGFQLSQRRLVAFRIDSLTSLQEIQQNHTPSIPEDRAHHFPCRWLCLELLFSRGIRMSLLSDSGSCWWHVSSPVTMLSRNLSPSASNWCLPEKLYQKHKPKIKLIYMWKSHILQNKCNGFTITVRWTLFICLSMIISMFK
jgi:hypothetical protein